MNRDNKPERKNYKEIHNDWNDSLESVNITGESKGIQASKNYKVHTGKTAKELNEELNWEKSILDSFTEEQLNRHGRLEKNQIESLKEIKLREKALKELKKVRDNKESWW